MAETFKLNVSEKKIQGKTLSPEPSSCRNWGKSTNLHPLGNSNLPEERGICIRRIFSLTLISSSQFVGEARAAGAGQVQAE